MRKSTLVLSILTATFAMSTVYLAHELQLRDADLALATAGRPDAVSTFAPGAADGGPDSAGNLTEFPTRNSISTGTEAARPAGVASATDSAKPFDASDPSTIYARQLVARLDDPNQRPMLVEEQRTVIRRQYEKLKEKLHLSDAAFEQFATLFAEEQLQAQERWARCAVTPGCDLEKLPGTPVDHTQEYQAMLGADGAEAFTQFRNSIGERDAVVQLRGRLGDSNFLPESQAERLIAALSEEREQYSKEVTARGGKIQGFGTNLGMVWYTEDSGLPEQYVAEASQYSRRLRARAASILTPAQLAAYTQMQEELLAQFNTFKRPPPARQNKSSVTRAS